MNPFKYKTMIKHLQESWLQNKMQKSIMGKLHCKKQEVDQNVRMLVSLYFTTRSEVETIKNMMIQTS